MGCVPGFQLAHAGRKAGTKTPWNGGLPLDDEDTKAGNPPWEIIAPSDVPVAEGWVIATEDVWNYLLQNKNPIISNTFIYLFTLFHIFDNQGKSKFFLMKQIL